MCDIASMFITLFQFRVVVVIDNVYCLRCDRYDFFTCRQELEKWLKVICELTKLEYKREKVHDGSLC